MKKIEIVNPHAEDWAVRLGIQNPQELILRRLDYRFPEAVATALFGRGTDFEIVISLLSEVAQSEAEFAVLMGHAFRVTTDTQQDFHLLRDAAQVWEQIQTGVGLEEARRDYAERVQQRLAEISQHPEMN